jgi:hypothetical protein
MKVIEISFDTWKSQNIHDSVMCISKIEDRDRIQHEASFKSSISGIFSWHGS